MYKRETEDNAGLRLILTEEILKPYTDPDSPKYKEMVKVMCQHLQLDSLQFQRLDDLVAAIPPGRAYSDSEA